MLPWWADALVVLAIPVILLTVLKLMGDELDNTVVHEQEDEPPDEPEDALLAA